MNTSTPAPTIAPEPMPVDVICEYLKKSDILSVELWKYCATQWSEGDFAFDPEHYFISEPTGLQEPGEEDAEALEGPDIDPDADPVDDPIATVTDDEEEALAELPEGEEPEKLSAEAREQIVLYAPYIRALKDFWTSMVIFTEDNPAVADWQAIVDRVNKYAAFVPVDRDRLIRHVQRLNSARIEAESLMPSVRVLQKGTALFEIRNSRF